MAEIPFETRSVRPLEDVSVFVELLRHVEIAEAEDWILDRVYRVCNSRIRAQKDETIKDEQGEEYSPSRPIEAGGRVDAPWSIGL